MKKALQKVKDFFKGVKETIEKHTNNDGYTAFMTFLFYVSLLFAALSFVSGLFQTMKFGGALLLLAGSYFSIRIIYNFTKDFVGLIKFYMANKEGKEDSKSE